MEFFSVMGQIWSKYSHLFLHGLWMTVYMGLVTVAISTVTGSILALIRRSSFKPLQWLVTVRMNSAMPEENISAGPVKTRGLR